MSLRDWFGLVATTTVATSATASAQHRPPVATVAGVAVANSEKDVLPAHWRWRIAFADGRAIEVRYVPYAQRKEVEAHYPGTKVEPLADAANRS